jgi:superfamily II DNA/RNA helicase
MDSVQTLKALVRKLSPSCKFILASATAPAATREFYATQFPKAHNIYLDAQYTIPDTISVLTKRCSGSDGKNAWVASVVEETSMDRMIVFASRREEVETVSRALDKLGLKTTVLHGGLGKDVQNSNLKSFQNKEATVLISSGIISRGVDLQGVTHVVLYQPPCNRSNQADLVNFVNMIGWFGGAVGAGFAFLLTFGNFF